MVRSARPIAGAGADVAMIVAIAVFAGCPSQRVSAQGSGAPAPSSVSAGGTTLRSVSVDFPDPGNLFPGDKTMDAINNNCLACHSAGMVLTQPHLSSADWQAEIDKMRDVYKAPIAETDVPAIVDYLVKLNTAK
jgi:hypothetical protein